MNMKDAEEKTLLEREQLEKDLTEAGFRQTSGGILPDDLMWTVYQHPRHIPDVPQCAWIVTNIRPPSCHLAAGWTDNPDHAYDQVMAYVHIWLRSEASFDSVRQRNANGNDADDKNEPSDGSTGPRTPQIIANTKGVLDIISKGLKLLEQW